MATPNIVPRSDSEGGLGTASKYWGSAYIDLIYVGAGKMGRDADNLLDFSTDDRIKFEVGGSVRTQMTTTALLPNVNDGYALGTSSYSFSDLFLADGAVINFDNGNVTLTHSSNALTLADGDYMQFGSSGDLQIYHSGASSAVNNTTGHLYISNGADGSDIIFQCDDGSGGVATYLTLDGGEGHMIASKELNFADSVAATFGNKAGGDLEIKEQSGNSYISNFTGNLNITNNANGADIIFQSDNGSGGVATYFFLDGSATQTTFQYDTRHNDSVKAKFGNGSDLQIYHDATDSIISNATGDLSIQNKKEDKDIIFQGDDGQASDNTITTYFYLDGSSATHDGSATTALYTNWPDNSRISLGTSHDLQIYHDGSTSAFIHNKIGDLYIKNDEAAHDIYFQCDDGGGLANYLTLDGGLGYTTVQKDIRFNDSVDIKLGTGNDCTIMHDGTDTWIDNGTGDLKIRNQTNDGHIIFYSDDGTGGVTEYFRINGLANANVSEKSIYIADNKRLFAGGGGDLGIYHDGTNNYIQGINGDMYIQNGADGKDVILRSDDGTGGQTEYFRLDGSAVRSVFLKNVLWADNVKARFGSGGDLDIYHDGSNSFIQDAGDGDLYIEGTQNVFIRDKDSGNVWFQGNQGGVNLRYQDNVKITTTNTGVTVTGSLTPSLGVTQTITSAASNITAVSGSIHNFSDADGAVVTLPDSGDGSQVGKTFEFVITTTATSNSHKIVCADTTNEKLMGYALMIDTDTSDNDDVFAAKTGNEFSAVNMNGTTTGIQGSKVKITNVAADLWYVEAVIHHTGNAATPFATS